MNKIFQDKIVSYHKLEDKFAFQNPFSHSCTNRMEKLFSVYPFSKFRLKLFVSLERELKKNLINDTFEFFKCIQKLFRFFFAIQTALKNHFNITRCILVTMNYMTTFDTMTQF